jgi:peptide deformylase
MSIRRIVTIGDAMLRKKARHVQIFGSKLHELLDDMLETMLNGEGIGLAAPQVNVSQQVIIVRLPDDEESVEQFGDQAGRLYEAVNPKIIRASYEMVDGIEGCLSIPGFLGTVLRHKMIIVRAQDRDGDIIRIKAHGWLARVFQHEIDHLQGVLFIDRAKKVWNLREELPQAVDEIL